ncbi:hypothetical protein [Pseudoalteromonas luteoviolacea]|uniref:DUF4878 domain-containing protein n=1 Tax=Pseudoalteromonas luteoviolacea H33 TaxID=1365251 RepID=A0A167FJL5_9GAMM|nr:hypothetical protein [Pseudoalteromonas luteoviolacea]KZN52410.1 hypothetical protein N476_10090 [Pseudoalteromonas luteoviolacea H33]KZN76658.1 hypothetical protein N477_16255 [Pseudoalteromonas luteoviolacea H33-S]MBQ4877157.1 hypothetical protein [Pseudoalteromonas luteoviolacea]MBQ4906018.1 hypothetical protein [Pseudoalteromonas luteoviolacea]
MALLMRVMFLSSLLASNVSKANSFNDHLQVEQIIRNHFNSLIANTSQEQDDDGGNIEKNKKDGETDQTDDMSMLDVRVISIEGALASVQLIIDDDVEDIYLIKNQYGSWEMQGVLH